MGCHVFSCRSLLLSTIILNDTHNEVLPYIIVNVMNIIVGMIVKMMQLS